MMGGLFPTKIGKGAEKAVLEVNELGILYRNNDCDNTSICSELREGNTSRTSATEVIASCL